MPSFICSPTARGGCGKIRVHGEHLKRYLLELIHERDPAAVEDPARARVRTALGQVQDARPRLRDGGECMTAVLDGIFTDRAVEVLLRDPRDECRAQAGVGRQPCTFRAVPLRPTSALS